MDHQAQTTKKNVGLENTMLPAWRDMSETIYWIEHIVEDLEGLNRIKQKLHRETDGLIEALNQVEKSKNSKKILRTRRIVKQLSDEFSRYQRQVLAFTATRAVRPTF